MGFVRGQYTDHTTYACSL